MKSKHCIRRSGTLISMLMLASGIPIVHGYEHTITAVFKPNSERPTENMFVNTTPNGGYCLNYPYQCSSTNIFSISAQVKFDSIHKIQANHNDVRQGAMFKVPSQWRKVDVSNANGDVKTIEIRVSGVGSRYKLNQDVRELVGVAGISASQAHARLWAGNSWVNAGKPCQSSGVGVFTAQVFDFFWKTPVPGVCAKRALIEIPSLRYEYLDFGYELRTPNPLGMLTGRYTGSVSYSIGPGQDFDMGDVMIPNDPLLRLKFELDVQHNLKIEIPPGSNNVELVPQGGWQSWIQKGRRPTRFFRDQTFNISTSSRFKMYLECEHRSGNTCAIKSESGDSVPLTVSVSLPRGIGNEIGQPVNYLRLLIDGSSSSRFNPTQYFDRRPGTLHFEVPANNMEHMLRPGAPSKYTGDVTVIWDSEV